MKVLSVLTSEAHGGGEYAAVDLLDALVARGHTATLLTNQPELVEGRRVQARQIELGPKLSRRSYRRMLSRWPLLVRALETELRREGDFDVLLTHYKKEQFLAASLPRRPAPVVAWAEWGPVPFPLRSGPGRLAYLAAARRTDAVMSVSQGTSDSVAAVGVPLRKLHVVPNALPVDELQATPEGRRRIRERLGIPDGAPVVGVVSRLNPKKRNDVAVDAVVALSRDDVHLVIAGEGPTEPDLRARAAALGGRAHFIPTPGKEVTDVLSAFDVAVFCPSPTEGAPLAVVHAMLAGRPVVASAAEGMAGMMPPGCGVIVSPENDPLAVAAALGSYLDDRARCRREGDAARALAERTYSAALVGEQVEQLLIAAGGERLAGRS